MTKGKPWPTEDEKNLKAWFTSGVTDFGVLAFNFDGRYTEEAVRQKLIKLQLIKEQQRSAANRCCSPELELPDEMPSVEEALKKLCAALKALETRSLDKSGNKMNHYKIFNNRSGISENHVEVDRGRFEPR